MPLSGCSSDTSGLPGQTQWVCVMLGLGIAASCLSASCSLGNATVLSLGPWPCTPWMSPAAEEMLRSLLLPVTSPQALPLGRVGAALSAKVRMRGWLVGFSPAPPPSPISLTGAAVGSAGGSCYSSGRASLRWACSVKSLFLASLPRQKDSKRLLVCVGVGCWCCHFCRLVF